MCIRDRWCTITASGDVTQSASQLAIGNVSAGTALAVTQDDVLHQQVGGEILGGSLRGTCGWSQYRYDWTAQALSVAAGCANPVHNTNEFVAANGTAIWSGCYPRCFGGVPLRFDRRCGQRGHNWCYGSNCEEYANFYPCLLYTSRRSGSGGAQSLSGSAKTIFERASARNSHFSCGPPSSGSIVTSVSAMKSRSDALSMSEMRLR